MTKKRFISFIGTTCAGKSTALKALKQSGAERLMVIPHLKNCFDKENFIKRYNFF